MADSSFGLGMVYLWALQLQCPSIVSDIVAILKMVEQLQLTAIDGS